MKRIAAKLTYANVMATIAVFVALGGASYAATELPRDSVGTEQLQDGAVTAGKMSESSVTGGKIHPGAVRGPDLGQIVTDTRRVDIDGRTIYAFEMTCAQQDAVPISWGYTGNGEVEFETAQREPEGWYFEVRNKERVGTATVRVHLYCLR